MRYPKVAISVGDPAGIGPGIILKAASHHQFPAHLIAVADINMLSQRAEQLGLSIQLQAIQPGQSTPHVKGTLQVLHHNTSDVVTAGQPLSSHAAYTLECLDKSIHLCETGQADALFTGPINKALISSLGPRFRGHTDYLAKHFKCQTTMLFVSPTQKMALLTDHIPLKEVPLVMTKSYVIQKIKSLHQAYRKWYGKQALKIAICGLNPHAGEQGFLGDEEISEIIPAIEQLTDDGFDIEGPLAADTLLLPNNSAPYDLIISLYHDQGLSAFKAINFGQSANITLGLPFMRGSVDHGTAYSLAGTHKASYEACAYALNHVVTHCLGGH